MDQVVVHVHVQLEAIFHTQCFNDLECHLGFLASVGQLGDDRQGVVAGSDACPPHLLQHLTPTIKEAIASTAVQEGVESHFIWVQVCVALHFLKELEGLFQHIGPTVGLDHCAVGDDAGRQALLHHLFQQRLGPRDLTTAGAHVQQGIVRRGGELHLLAHHFLIDLPNTIEALLVVEALENRAVGHRSHQAFCVGICQRPLDHFIGTLWVVVGGQCFDHAPQSDSCRFHSTTFQVIPGVPNAFHVTRGTIGADDGATCVRAADLNEASLVAEPLHVLQKVLHLTTADARFIERSQKNFVDVFGLASVDNLHDIDQELVLAVLPRTLQKNGTSDVVRG
mmetsp:Transcript_46265/g.100747  ORF Transcript_46265/g.100747 Transcript_46265/m.100747 type:complete len:337 (-) Transcript_46265:938-1948(-)